MESSDRPPVIGNIVDLAIMVARARAFALSRHVLALAGLRLAVTVDGDDTCSQRRNDRAERQTEAIEESVN